ncbi:Hypothetical predicted protein [Mytilus galloprovincialis]|nr:Hypothetical predicted protein [Mytilus galloprovincialis]
MGDLYQITKKLCGQKRNTNMPVKDKQGNLITSEREQENRWNEHFKEVLNRPEPETTANIPIAEHDLELQKNASLIGLNINIKKSEVMPLNTTEPPLIDLNGTPLDCTSSFTYLGSIVTSEGGADKDIRLENDRKRHQQALQFSQWLP